MVLKYLQIAKLLLPEAAAVIYGALSRQLGFLAVRLQARFGGSTPAEDRTLNIVIVGASFAGYHAACTIARALPAKSAYRVVVIEPNSHFQFSWVLPRYCVVEGHEHKAFVPYQNYLKGVPKGCVRWIQGRVESMTNTAVTLHGTGETILYQFLVMATGAAVQSGLPSRVNQTNKIDGIERLQAMQQNIKTSRRLVIVGGGAAGVELAADVKDRYPQKAVTLVHSRSALMHRFGPRLQKAALEGLEKLGVEVVLGQRLAFVPEDSGSVTLESGRVIECDHFVSGYPLFRLSQPQLTMSQVNCTGQAPSSSLLAAISPSSITTTNHIKTKPTLQVADNELSNVYACGDVTHVSASNRNSRSAMRQAEVVADNILLAARGGSPHHVYRDHWTDATIKLTLGIVSCSST